jgi:hypothetical protein
LLDTLNKLIHSRLELNSKWYEFNISHIKPNSDYEMRQTNKRIRDYFRERLGVYIYLNDKEEVLYVGIGKLAERVRFHYYESFGKYSGKNCEKHIKFFTQYPGQIRIMWTEIKPRDQQKNIENLLTDILQPKYEQMKKKGLLH